MYYKHILVTTDFSEVSKAAFDFAAYQAKMEGSKITLLHVIEPFSLPPELQRVIWNPEGVRKMEEEYLEGSKQHLWEFARKYFHGQDVETVSQVSSHPPAAEICNYAKENNCDLIVMAGHGRGAVGRFFLGSVVQKVLCDAHCPVLVIRGEDEEEEGEKAQGVSNKN